MFLVLILREGRESLQCKLGLKGHKQEVWLSPAYAKVIS